MTTYDEALSRQKKKAAREKKEREAKFKEHQDRCKSLGIKLVGGTAYQGMADKKNEGGM